MFKTPNISYSQQPLMAALMQPSFKFQSSAAPTGHLIPAQRVTSFDDNTCNHKPLMHLKVNNFFGTLLTLLHWGLNSYNYPRWSNFTFKVP
jgi:hypothetical protein